MKRILTKGNMVLSIHAIKRYSERFSKNSSELRRTSKNAFYNGVGYKSVGISRPLIQYIQSKYRKYKNCDIRILGEITFIFIQNKYSNRITLKTVLKTPPILVAEYSKYKFMEAGLEYEKKRYIKMDRK